MDQEDTLPLDGIEWSMEVDRALAGRYGLSVQQAGAVLQFVTEGLLIDKYRPDDADDEIDIRARYPEENRTILGLDAVRMQTPEGSVPLSNFVRRTAKPQVDRIVRRNGQRIIEVKANGNTRIPGYEVSQDQAIAHMRDWLDSGALGENVTWVMRGADEDTAAALSFFRGAMAAAMFMIAMILLLEFNSFLSRGPDADGSNPVGFGRIAGHCDFRSISEHHHDWHGHCRAGGHCRKQQYCADRHVSVSAA